MRNIVIPAALVAVLASGAALMPPPAAAQGGAQSGDRGGRAGDWSGGGMERHGREQFERGFRQGREDERRRRAERQGDGQASGRDPDRYIVVPDYYPERVPFQRSVIVPDYSRSMDWLLTAAQSLREAIQAMAQQPAGERRDRAMDQAREALLETQQAMIQLPPELRQR